MPWKIGSFRICLALLLHRRLLLLCGGDLLRFWISRELPLHCRRLLPLARPGSAAAKFCGVTVHVGYCSPTLFTHRGPTINGDLND
ncbi:hypothetical protein SLEP1_g53033 [Rubroshorea leprosula]|uniref:Secreted protein n=1 Tax=Rubroshorea leprosula TaxID=152421 RepID=A0AAV5M8B4_9ROSI|nr:hypothetical protein SLEP1_g53033 [Rubroshorea leprosula]